MKAGLSMHTVQQACLNLRGTVRRALGLSRSSLGETKRSKAFNLQIKYVLATDMQTRQTDAETEYRPAVPL